MSRALLTALGLAGPDAPRLVQLIGAGGKTTTMFALSAALRATGARVVSTTTTRILRPRREQSPALLLLEDHSEPWPALDRELASQGHVSVARAALPGGKLAGLEPGELARLLERDASLRVVCECDGAQGRPLKAHAAHEPVLLDRPGVVVAVVGLDALGAPLDDARVHRASLLAERLGRPLGSILDPSAIAGAVEGYLERIPPRCRPALLLTQWTPERAPAAMAIARALDSGRLERIVAASHHSARELSPPR